MKNMQVLLVDDEERFLSNTRFLLEKRGLAPHTAGSGREAMRILEDKRIDVVVLDVNMPDMDGIETLRLIKHKFPLVEVIMMNGRASVDAAVDGMRLGAFDYLMKPCDITDMIAKIREAFTKKQVTEEQNRKRNVERIISHPLAVFDRNGNNRD
jgi:DNA-binding NtrC family response regulator